MERAKLQMLTTSLVAIGLHLRLGAGDMIKPVTGQQSRQRATQTNRSVAGLLDLIVKLPRHMVDEFFRSQDQ